jgi:hypothetical protein
MVGLISRPDESSGGIQIIVPVADFEWPLSLVVQWEDDHSQHQAAVLDTGEEVFRVKHATDSVPVPHYGQVRPTIRTALPDGTSTTPGQPVTGNISDPQIQRLHGAQYLVAR